MISIIIIESLYELHMQEWCGMSSTFKCILFAKPMSSADDPLYEYQ